MFRCCVDLTRRGGWAIANVFATMGGIYQIIDAKKKRPDFWGSGLLPLSVTGGSVAAAIPWELC